MEKEGFHKRHLIMMSLGNIVGSGIFLGSSTVLSLAGPAAILAYLLGGLMMAIEVMFIAEMCVINPAPGAFRVHATEIFGPWIGFVNGWMFWCSSVLGMASEVAAAAVFTQFWLPQIPLWIFCILYSLMMAAVNLNDLKGLGRMEAVLASVKLLALILFIVFGFLALSGILPLEAAPFKNPFSSFTRFFPHGIKGVLSSMILVMFSYTGTGIIGLALADTEKPEKNAPKAIAVISGAVILLYGLSVLLLILFSAQDMASTKISPFVSVLERIKLPYSDSILNFVVLTAALSGLNSSMYSSSRMLYSLSRDKQAPKIFLTKNKNGVPFYAIGFGSFALLFTAVLSYFLPKQVFVLLATASGFIALINWLTISVTHYFYRKKTLKEHPEKLKYKAPAYPFLSFLEVFLIVLIFCTAPLYAGQLSGLVGGIILVMGLALCYVLLKKGGRLR